MSFGSRIWFAWSCFFKVLFDGRFAARVEAASSPARALEEAPAAPPKDSAPEEPDPEPEPKPKPKPKPKPAGKPEKKQPPSVHAALQLLALFQREGRLVDFLKQDVASFDDAEIGAAARVVHEGCRKALDAHAQIEPVRAEDEGANVSVESGFDPASIKLTGDVRGAAPYRGVLRHRGWRATSLELPEAVGENDSHVLAPAEVEL